MNEIKLLRFDGVWIISEVEEIPDVEFGDPDCVLKYPYEVEGSCLGPFPLHAREREFIVRSSEISLISEPTDFIYNQYRGLVEVEKPDPPTIEEFKE
jgi:hypothetical protein